MCTKTSQYTEGITPDFNFKGSVGLGVGIDRWYKPLNAFFYTP